LSCLIGGCEEFVDTTSIDANHRYGNSVDFLSIGNNGLAGYQLEYNVRNYSKFSWSKLISSNDSLIKEYNVKRPFTSLTYVVGSKEEQVLRLLHTQNINKLANFSIGFDKLKNKGFYINQASNNNHLFANIWLKDKGNRYKVVFNFDHSRIFNEHNGGVLYDSLFEQDLLLNRNRELMEVNLSEASSTIKKYKADINQSYTLFNNIDSLGMGNRHKLFLNVTGKVNSRVFKDTLINTDYYSYIFYDSSSTYDEVKYNCIDGSMGYEFYLKNMSEVTVSPFANYQIINYEQNTSKGDYSSLSAGIYFKYETEKLKLKSKVKYYFDGYRLNDIETNGKITFDIFQNWEVTSGFLFNRISPALDLNQYKGNNVNWINSFNKTDYVSLFGVLYSDRAKFS